MSTRPHKILEKGGQVYSLSDPIMIDAFIAAGWKVVEQEAKPETAEETKKPRRAKK